MKKITLITLFLFFVCACITAQDTSVVKDYHSYPYWIEMMQDPDANFFETQKAFYNYWDGREMTKGNGYKAFKRWEYWMARKASPDGRKPAPDRNIKAIQSLKTFSNSTSSQNPDELNRTTTTNGNWTTLGPSSVPSGNNGYRGIGRVNAIAFHPTDANTIYIGSPAGGLWVTNNGGSTWTTNTDILPTLGISAIITDYSNPSIIYIGTGDRDHGDAPGAGVWKSIDGGVTFQPSNTGMSSATVSRLVIHPSDPNILLAATNNGIFRSINGGVNWSQTSTGNYKDIVFKPGDPNIVYASASGNFYRSINNGVSFTQISSGLTTGYRGAIAVSPANPNYVYFWVTNSDSFKGLYRSTDAGLTFSVRSTTPNIMSWDCNGGSGGQAWYDLDMACDPTNAEIIYGGGVNCFKSTNGGQTWSINSHWYGGCGVPSVHADLHVLEYNPLNNRLFTGNDGGVYWTSNGGTSWTEISNGLVISQAYKIGQSRTGRNNVINGYQDNGTSTYIGTDWVNVNGGDGMECAYDPTDNNYSYSSIYYGDIYRHLNNNDDGQIAGNGVNGITESGAWVTPYVIDPNDGNIMFIGYDNVWRSTNVKGPTVSWTKISTINASDLDVMCQSDANPNCLYVSNDNNLYRSDNCKASSVFWTNLTSTLPSTNYITAIETSPVDENIVYLVQQNHVYKSTNKGVTWIDITGNLPDVQMHTLVYYHNSIEGLYLGTDIGVFYRDANNPTWITYSTGLPAAAWVTELEIYYDQTNPSQNILRAGTFGRGLWESPLLNTAAPAAAGSIVGPEVVCQGQTQVTYSVEEIQNATAYVWTLPEGATGSSSTNTITVDFSIEATSGEVSVYGTNQYGTGDASALFVSVNSLPGEAGYISGPAQVCQNETSVVYSIESVANANSYVWTLPAGATGSSTTNSITVDFTNSTNGTISVYGLNDCGMGYNSALQVIVTPLPGNAGAISGMTSVCEGQSDVVYSIQPVPNATAYTWSLPPGALGNSITNNITIAFPPGTSSGEITVTPENDCAQGTASALPINVNVIPAVAGTITGLQVLCQDTYDVTYSVPLITGATAYQWTLPPGATGSSNTNTINVDFGINAVSGNISVYASNNCGDGNPSSFFVTVNAKPVTPVISNNGHTIHSNAPSGNQWYDQTGIISGATEQEYTVTWDGDYYSIVTLNGCSSDPSNTLTVIVTSTGTLYSENGIMIYPNPVTSELTIEIKNNLTIKTIDILNTAGQMVYTGGITDKIIINTDHYSPGVYLVRLTGDNAPEFIKIIKE